MALRVLKPVFFMFVSLALVVSCDSSDEVETFQPIVPGLDIDISASKSSTSPGSPVSLTVRARNVSDSRIAWGQGSSTCQLHSVARVEGVDRRTVESRDCLDDIVEQGLDPGEVRTESWDWFGDVVVGSQSEDLPAGPYDVRGAAGDAASSPIEIYVLR